MYCNQQSPYEIEIFWSVWRTNNMCFIRSSFRFYCRLAAIPIIDHTIETIQHCKSSYNSITTICNPATKKLQIKRQHQFHFRANPVTHYLGVPNDTSFFNIWTISYIFIHVFIDIKQALNYLIFLTTYLLIVCVSCGWEYSFFPNRCLLFYNLQPESLNNSAFTTRQKTLYFTDKYGIFSKDILDIKRMLLFM